MNQNLYYQMIQIPNNTRDHKQPFERDNYRFKSLNKIAFNQLLAICTVLFKIWMIVNFMQVTQSSKLVDNTCTFSIDGKLFSFTQLNKITHLQTDYKYLIDKNPNSYIKFNFCETFVPAQCSDSNLAEAYTYHIIKSEDSNQTQCIPYSSDSKSSNFNTSFTNVNGQISVFMQLFGDPESNNTVRATYINLQCQEGQDGILEGIQGSFDESFSTLTINGKSPHGCPVFQLSSIYAAISDNSWIFGIILIAVGFIMLFFGVLMTHVVIFVSAYFLSFAVLVSIFTAFMGPESSRLAIYFALLLVLFLATLIAYALTRLVNVSIFLIGAFLGFIVGAMVNTIFVEVTGIVSDWSLIIIQILFMIPFGLLTFKFSEQIIVLSSSLTGSYLLIRPFSWIFGGFPNQFRLYQEIEKGQLEKVPWTFYLYFIIILLIAIMGALYQLLKLKRRKTDQQIEKNFITENVQQHIDRIHEAVKNLISKYNKADSKEPNESGTNYKKMVQLEQFESPNLKNQSSIEMPNETKYRKSREQDF